MRFAVVTVSLLALAGGVALEGAPPDTARRPAAKNEFVVRLDDSTRGDLAFATNAGGPWTVARRGDVLPPQAFLRTSAAGPCRVQIAGGTLQLSAETRAQLVAPQRQITVSSGRVFGQALPGWSVTVRNLKGTLAADAAVEFESGEDRAAGKVLAGEIQITSTDLEPTVVKAGQAFARDKSAAKPELSDLSPAEIQRLRAQTDAAPPRPQGLGQLVVSDPQSGSPVRLNLARYHVNVVLHPPVALVQIDQSFYNPFPQQQEGTFVFNLPEGASVSRFAMYTTPAQLVEGELVEREKAAKIYQSIVNQQRDPAILEQIGGNLFRMRVFPIFARDTKRILLDYTVPIVEQDEGRYTFELPLMSDLEPVWDFSITGTVRGPNLAGTVRSLSHPELAIDTGNGAAVKFALQKQAYQPDSAFVLAFQQRPGAEATVRSFVPTEQQEPSGEAGTRADEGAPGGAENHAACEFLATISPQVLGKAAVETAPSPADLLILADTSGGVSDRARLRRAVRTIVTSLRAEDRFRLGCVDVGYRPVSKDWTAPLSPEADAALAQLDREFFLGETDFDEGLSGAVNTLPAVEEGRRRFVVYVGDGVLPAGPAVAEAAQKQRVATLTQGGARFCAVLVEHDSAGTVVMEQLAGATGGRLFREAAGASSGALFQWLLTGCPAPPRIISVSAAGVRAEDLFVPTTWFPGHSLHIYGRRKETGPLKLSLQFERGGKTDSRDWTLQLKRDPDDLFVGRLWAQCKLDRLRFLSATQTGDQEQQRLVKQIVGLSQEWTLLSPHTAFLVLENEAEYPKYGIRRQLRHQYWKPADAVAAGPLPKQALEMLKTPARPTHPVTAREFGQALSAARKALDDRAPKRALMSLDGVARSPLAATSAEYKALEAAARKLQVQGDLLRNLGPQRGWFDRKAPFGFDSPASELVWQMLYGYGSAGSAVDPRLAVLAKRVAPPPAGTTLEDFAKWFQETSGLEFWIDKATLTDEGVALDQEVRVKGIRSMSLESLLFHVLTPMQLTTVFEDDVLKLTTSAKAGEKLSTQLYPVSDLIQSTRSTEYSLLVNADLDRELLSRRRLGDRLNRKIAVEFADLPLEDALDFLGEQLNDNLIVDLSTLTDEGVALDQPVNLKSRGLPLKSILAQLLEPLQLTFSIENEAVVVTTSARAGEKLDTRFHSGMGIVYELPPEMVQHRQSRTPFLRPGGFGGGFGGGMMGMPMGGMLGGMMGNFGGGAPPAPSGNATVSESTADGDALHAGDDVADASRDRDPETPADDDEGVESGVLDPPPVKTGLPARRRATTTAPDTINLIEQTIQPDSWEALSGPGSIVYFPGSLGFVVQQTAAVHQQIEELLGRLRQMPPAFADRSGYAPAKIPVVGPGDIDNWDIRTLLDLIVSVIQPDSWEELSGPGSVQLYAPKLVLSVRQTHNVHFEVRNLLTVLRRARYLARQGQKWNSFDLAEGPWFTAALGLTDLPTTPRQADLPEPDGAELAALAVLREPPAVSQTWRLIPADGRPPQTTVIRQQGARNEFEFDGRLARVEADEAAVAYPAISIVERGAWGEALRRIVDGRLPWLPHRSRRELAGLFQVKVVAQDDQSVQLRLAIPGAAEGSDILLTVGRRHGLPTEWESRLDGRPVLRLRFEELDETGGQPFWKKVIAEDAAGFEIERWELVHSTTLRSDIVALDAGWNDSLLLDLREQERPHSPLLVQILRAIRLRDWPAADRALAEALKDRPEHPLLLLIKAWSLTQRDGDHEAEIVPLLKGVARGGGGAALLQSRTEKSFAALGDAGIYEILLEQPIARRRVSDWDNLAQAAVRAGKPHEAAAHLKAAIDQAGPAGDDPERARQLVELLLETRHVAEGVALAAARAARPDVKPEDLLGLAEALHQWGALSEAAKFLRQALAGREVAGERRYRLLQRRANLETGPVRWRTLMEAIETLPPRSPLRAASTEAILADLTDAALGDQAGKMGDEAKDRTMQAAFRLRQAELFLLRANLGAAADIGWTLYESKQLPAERIPWLFARLAAARQDERLIQVAEERLRAGKALEFSVFEALGTAYEAVGRPDAARRARTNARDLPASPRGGFMTHGPTMGVGFFAVE
jgi:hypothetical protein